MSLVGQKREPRNKFKNSLRHSELSKKSKKIGNYSFVHYAERDQALAAIEQMNGKEISPGETITCTIAKPSENNRNQNRRGRGNKNQYGWNPWVQAPEMVI